MRHVVLQCGLAVPRRCLIPRPVTPSHDMSVYVYLRQSAISKTITSLYCAVSYICPSKLVGLFLDLGEDPLGTELREGQAFTGALGHQLQKLGDRLCPLGGNQREALIPSLQIDSTGYRREWL